MTTSDNKQTHTDFPLDDYFRKYYYDIQKVAKACMRCSQCKWIDWWEVKNARFSRVCPCNTRYLFDSYSCQGKMDVSLALLEGRLNYEDSPGLLDIFYKCDTCGGCDASCKRVNDAEPLRLMLDMRAKLVEDGQLLPQHMVLIDSLRKKDNMMMKPKDERGKWTVGLDVKDLTKETSEVVFHAGCSSSYDERMWPLLRNAMDILKAAKVDFGILGKDESCCGCRAYDMGYRGEFTKFAQNNLELWKNAGVKTVVTACADCYYAFKRLYPELDSKVQVFHITEYLDRLIKGGQLKLTRKVPLTVTYHDPCHLGRRSNVYVPGKAIQGVYEEPRSILKAIPGLQLVEMYRIKEYAWCCGAGGGVKEAYPDFSQWTANERLLEAKTTGAKAIVSACSWCERNFLDAMGQKPDIEVLDIVDLVRKAL
jgi:Fe-S oxidoreductase